MVSVSCGEDHTLIIAEQTDETYVYSMGSNSNGKLGLDLIQDVQKYA